MYKNEKDLITPNENESTSEAFITLYGGSSAIQAAVSNIPLIGATLHTVLSSKAQAYSENRIMIFLDELHSRLKKLETLEVTDEESCFYLMNRSFEYVVKARSEQKIKRFARLASDYLCNNQNWDEIEVALTLADELTDTHVEILSYISNIPESEIETFKGLKAVTVYTEATLDLPRLESRFEKLSEGALKMYCSSLISKGLLHDEGIGRFDSKAVEIIVPVPLTNWFLEKIQDMDRAK